MRFYGHLISILSGPKVRSVHNSVEKSKLQSHHVLNHLNLHRYGLPALISLVLATFPLSMCLLSYHITHIEKSVRYNIHVNNARRTLAYVFSHETCRNQRPWQSLTGSYNKKKYGTTRREARIACLRASIPAYFQKLISLTLHYSFFSFMFLITLGMCI